MGLNVPHQSFQLEIFSHFLWPQAIFQIFWPNKSCVTGASFRLGPRFKFICSSNNCKNQTPSERKGNAGSAEVPELSWDSHWLVCEPGFMPRNSIRNGRMLSIKSTLQVLQLMKKGLTVVRSNFIVLPRHIYVALFLHFYIDLARISNMWR